MTQAPKPRKYQMPDFISAVTQDKYEKWLHGRAVAHVKRDKKRGNMMASNEAYTHNPNPLYAPIQAGGASNPDLTARDRFRFRRRFHQHGNHAPIVGSGLIAR